MLRNDADSWGAPAKLFHWVMAVLIGAQIALGLMAAAWRLSPAKIELFFWHKSTGMLILLLAALRIVWRLTNPTPALPSGMPAWERAAARSSHLLLYLLMGVALGESGLGIGFEDAELTGAVDRLLADTVLRQRMANDAVRLEANPGTFRAADLIERVAATGAPVLR